MRRLLLLLVLALAAVPAQAQNGVSFGRNKIAYERLRWHVLKTEHFDVYYYPEARALAEMGAAIAESQVAELEQRFATSLGGRTPLIFYSSNIHFKQTNTTPGFIPDGVGGFFEFLKGRVVLPANGNLHGFRRVIRHELVHVFTFTKLLRVFLDHRTPTDRFLPLWFTEGLAEFWSGSPDYQHEMMLRDALASGYFVPLENLERIEGTYQMYKEGEAFFHFVREQYGEEKILQMIEESWRDRDFRHVMARVLGEPYRTTSDRFSAWLKARYYPALHDAQLASAVTSGIGVEGFAAKPAFYRRADGTRTVLYVGNRDGYASVFETVVDSLYRRKGTPKPLVRGERSNRFEAFHLFESRISVAQQAGRLAFVTKSGETDVVHSYDLDSAPHGGHLPLSAPRGGLLAHLEPGRHEARLHRHRAERLCRPVRLHPRHEHARPGHERRLRRPRPRVEPGRRHARLLVRPGARGAGRLLHALQLRLCERADRPAHARARDGPLAHLEPGRPAPRLRAGRARRTMGASARRTSGCSTCPHRPRSPRARPSPPPNSPKARPP